MFFSFISIFMSSLTVMPDSSLCVRDTRISDLTDARIITLCERYKHIWPECDARLMSLCCKLWHCRTWHMNKWLVLWATLILTDVTRDLLIDCVSVLPFSPLCATHWQWLTHEWLTWHCPCVMAGSPESVLETLTDVTHEYYLQFMNHLRAAADSAAMHGQSGFPVGASHTVATTSRV